MYLTFDIFIVFIFNSGECVVLLFSKLSHSFELLYTGLCEKCGHKQK